MIGIVSACSAYQYKGLEVYLTLQTLGCYFIDAFKDLVIMNCKCQCYVDNKSNSVMVCSDVVIH